MLHTYNFVVGGSLIQKGKSLIFIKSKGKHVLSLSYQRPKSGSHLHARHLNVSELNSRQHLNTIAGSKRRFANLQKETLLFA